MALYDELKAAVSQLNEEGHENYKTRRDDRKVLQTIKSLAQEARVKLSEMGKTPKKGIAYQKPE